MLPRTITLQADATPKESPTEWARIAAISIILALFTLAILIKLYLAYHAGDETQIDSTINLLVGFVSAIFLYLGIRVGQTS